MKIVYILILEYSGIINFNYYDDIKILSSEVNVGLSFQVYK